ncbi:MAG TPA: CHASE3 domain-containing protein [Gemmatimonadaceae bacterium]|nr:CHASE3 domain-containing protein [Gemmatimonadaceae bacterium]
MNKAFEKRYPLGIAVVVAIIVANTALAYWNTVQLYAAAEGVAHSERVQGALEQVLTSAAEAETGQRGYLITGNERYLEPFKSAEQRIDAEVSSLAQLTRDNADQEAEVPRLQRFIVQKLDELRLTVAVRKENGADAARAIVLTDRGRVAMDSLHAVVDRMETREREMIAAKTDEYRRSRDSAVTAGLAAGITALVLVTAFVTLQQRSFRSRAVAADQLFEQKELFRTTLASIGDAVISTDRDARVTFLNPVAEQLTGWRSSEAEGAELATVFEIVNEETRDPVQNPALRALRDGSIIALQNHTVLVAKSGAETPIDDSAAPIRDAHGNMTGAVLIFRDITERKAAERALRDADRRKDEFLAVLAHELRNPLAPMRNALEMVRLSADDPAVVGKVRGTMERQIEHMVRLTDDLLDVSRITRNRLELRRKPVDLSSVVHRAMESSDPLLKERRHSVSLALPASPLIVDADEGRLAQVLYNLLGNAAKYTHPGGRIHVQARRDGSDAVITVSDNGIGIARENLQTVFEMFTQVDSSLERSQGGLGIGLTLSRRIVELHGGTIEAASDGAGRGSTMTVRMRAVESASRVDQPPARTFALAKGRRVLIADDNRDSADTLASMLEMVGHDVRICYDGVNALTQAELFRPEIMLLDIGMPVLNGLELAARIRERPWGADIRLIALTGWGQPEDVKRSQRAGFDHHLVKPVELARLQELIGAAV